MTFSGYDWQNGREGQVERLKDVDMIKMEGLIICYGTTLK